MAPSRLDASALLLSQGWRGTGHSLDANDRGVKKPLLIAHKQDTMGLGTKKAAHKTDDQWWMRAFDESLKNIGTGVESTLSQVRKQGVNRGGLYGFFVKGEGLVGTIGEEESSADASRASTPPTSVDMSVKPASTKTKRKREGDTGDEDRKRRKEDKKSEKRPKQKLSEEKESLPNGTHDAATDKTAAVWKRIDFEVKKQIKKSERKGDYGPAISANKAAEDQKKLAIRTARSTLKKNLVVDAMMKGDLPNPHTYTREQALANYSTYISAKEKAERHIKETPNLRNEALEAQQAETRSQLQLSLEQPVEAPLPASVAAKIANLTPEEILQYNSRAKAKNQTLEEYVQRRIEKKKPRGEKKAAKKTEAPPLISVTSLLTKTDLDKTARKEAKRLLKLEKKAVSSKKKKVSFAETEMGVVLAV